MQAAARTEYNSNKMGAGQSGMGTGDVKFNFPSEFTMDNQSKVRYFCNLSTCNLHFELKKFIFCQETGTATRRSRLMKENEPFMVSVDTTVTTLYENFLHGCKVRGKVIFTGIN